MLQTLVIRRSVIGKESITHLQTIMSNIFPVNLVTLKIEKCQIDKDTTLALVEAL